MEHQSPALLGEVRGVKLFSDGSVHRTDKPLWPDIPADPTFNHEVASKDVILDQKTGLWARFFLPKSATLDPSQPKKLPILVYFHGGGFVAFNPNSSIFHNLCNSVSPKIGILSISLAYRLAPEHRLPVAFDDSFFALKWLQEQALSSTPVEPWLQYADFSSCFLMGGSAGGTIVHDMAVKSNHYDLSPVKIRGLFPVVPFFGGVNRSESEIRSLTEPDVLTLEDCDTFWSFSLPEGADRDHPYSRVPSADEIRDLHFPPSLIVVGMKDVLYTRQVEYYEEMKKAGKDAKLLQYKNHGHFLLFPDVEDDLEHSYNEITQFISKCLST